MKPNTILDIKPLDFHWPTQNPFLFCAHHLDYYPAGNGEFGPPEESLKGRHIGQDFTIKDGWRMYHGQTIPGFPVHPHRGFETITVVLQGMVDHSDSHGQAGRYGGGDVQWMTAGAGLQHSEMFPLLNTDKENTCELFQLWLNLPKAKKFADPYFKMLWSEDIPKHRITNENNKFVEINVIAGRFGEMTALSPAPDSWAADPANEVAVWTIKMEAGTRLLIPSATAMANRSLYFYRGDTVKVQGVTIDLEHVVDLQPDTEVEVISGDTDNFLLFLQGRPIQEAVVQYGPFVMNTQDEIRQAIRDYQLTEFGGWPWRHPDMVHGKERGRFARHRDGQEEVRG